MCEAHLVKLSVPDDKLSLEAYQTKLDLFSCVCCNTTLYGSGSERWDLCRKLQIPLTTIPLKCVECNVMVWKNCVDL